jgi:formylglycine-generating enzyme required for sulfatase activity
VLVGGCSGRELIQPDGGGGAGTGGQAAGGGAAGTTSDTGAGGSVGGAGGPPPCPAVDGMTMVRVPAGFCIDTTEVTRAQYGAWLARSPSTAGQSTSCASNTTFQPNALCMASDYVCGGVNCDSHPQVCVDWCDASAYCTGVGKRLCGRMGGGALGAMAAALSPTESEWVHACTAGATSDWPYGPSAIADRCNTTIDRYQGTTPVGSLGDCTSAAAGFAGIFDMVGNVWEMQDACDGKGDDSVCIYRGGSFADATSTQSGTDRGCASSWAYAAQRENFDAELGFRCCAD